ncbi:signal transduction histidine kinase [Actinoalloteichus hoggarensis]|uniref:Signal transduction histidine-protein kinase/phosphatase MprB n=1 Tax=Actinoalloteichus hoggarensis TaxID=1470176 RepID=A0A221WAE6_9PSEU|nr:ATP-binding protein [Actinoalloteichus hoggarensis]ASO22546.1 Signal transduction histidine-protein kinase ArlS [Actinoalloteichus hoggarensis]MBB5923030.1 signal transduction histidine kinase [Actinoalloteichus hoggarensis]
MRTRILQSILLAVSVTVVVLGLPLGLASLRLVEDVTRRELTGRVQQIATSLDAQLAEDETLDLVKIRVAVPADGSVTVSLPGQGTVRDGPDPGPDPVIETASIVRQGTVTLAVPSGPLRASQAQMAGAVLLLVLLTVVVGLVMAKVTARRLSEPLRHVAARAARLGAGDFRPDTRRHGAVELDRVADALDASALALARLMERERELVGDVSHQLRSHLTALQLRLEELVDPRQPVNREEARAALVQAEKLSRVLEDLLATATAARSRTAEPLDLAEELPEVVAEWRERLRAEGRTLRLRISDGLPARVTPARLREALGVLLENALIHGAGTVSVVARLSGAMVMIEVTDNGNGVPEELSRHVFDRGFSGGGSTGVGLSLARALVEADGGRLELYTARPATFVIFLLVPRAGDVLGMPWPVEPTPR